MDLLVDSFDFDSITIRDANSNLQTFNMVTELMINEHNLRQDLELQASKYMYWTSILEKMRAYLESAKLDVEVAFSELYEPSRMKLVTQNNIAKPTKEQINSEILTQERYLLAKEKANNLQSQVNRLQYIVKALEQRKDMLIQISTDERKQREYENAIKTY